MSAGTLAVLLVLTFLISWYAAWGLGRYWTESRIVGGWLRVVVVAGILLAGLGFTWTYLTLLTAAAVGVGFVTLDQARLLYNLGYPSVVGPLLGGGSAVGIHSRILAYRRREYGEPGVVGYGANADVQSIWWAASNATDVLGNVLDAAGYGRLSRAAKVGSAQSGLSAGGPAESIFPKIKLGGGSDKGGWSGGGGGDDDALKAAAVLVIVMLAILAVAGGMITTALIVRHADRIHASDVAAVFGTTDERRGH